MKRILILTFLPLIIITGNVFVNAQIKSDSADTKSEEAISAEKIIDNYINAIGGKSELLRVKDRTTVMKGSTGGREVKITIYQKLPDKMREIINAGSFIQNIYFNGKKGIMEVGGKTFDVKGTQLQNLKYESSLHLLPKLDSLGIKLKFAGTVRENGKKSYKVVMIFPSGSKWTQYYDAETWLKVKESKEVKTVKGSYTQNTYLGNYQEVAGIKYPFSVKQILGRQTMNLKVTMISVNDNLNDKLFEINY